MKFKSKNLIPHALLIVISLGMFTPFLWLVSTSLKPFGGVFAYPPVFIPEEFRWQNFSEVFQVFPLGRFFLNSIVVTVGRTVGTVVTSALAAYAFARLEFPGRDKLFILYLVTLMIPFQVVMIPLFIIMKKLNWIDTYWAMIVPGSFNALGVFLLRQFFLTLPKSLEESAFIDGASYWTIFTRIILPLSKPALASLTVLTFLWSWNDFLWPLVVVDSMEMNTLTLGISKFQGMYYTEWNLLMAGTLIVMAPLVVIYLSAQKYFVEGITTTGLK